MSGRRQRPTQQSPQASETEGLRASRGYLAAAVGAVCLGIALGWSLPDRQEAEAQPPEPSGAAAGAFAHPALPRAPLTADAPAPVATAAAPAPVMAAAPNHLPRVRGADEDQTPDISAFVNPGEKPTMAEVIRRLHQAGEYGGLGAFNPPGTRPPLVGLAVPDDFVLPDGYVRHYQATDDGQRIEPVLMFSLDRPRLDAAGRPLLGREERVVPPELAPPGLPLRRIVIPPADPGR